jgi:c-di-GMP-binding flagellar brake protein YcgR
MIKERRLKPRKKVSWPSIIQLHDKSGLKANTVDISEAGVLLLSKIKLSKDDKVVLYIMANIKNKTTKIKAQAECRFVAKSGDNYNLGLRFLDISLRDKHFLRKFVESPSISSSIMPSPSEVKHVSSQFN